MTERRALTLVEVLVATALLAVLVATLLPFAVRASRSLSPRPAPVDMDALSGFADAVMSNPGAFQIADLNVVEQTTIAWPGSTTREVTIRRVSPAELSDDEPYVLPHRWLAFTCEDVTVLRWVPAPDDAAMPEEGA